MLKINVERSNGSYPIFIGFDLLKKAEDIFTFYKFKGKILLITTPEFEKKYRSYIRGCLKPYKGNIYIKVYADAESAKHLHTIDEIIWFLLKKKFDQHSVIISFGETALHEIAGFAANMFLNGIAHIIIPTSLEAQLKSTVAAKVRLNHQEQIHALSLEGKPTFVWNDLKFIQSDSKPALAAGLIEAIRVAIIWDEKLFEFIEKHLAEIYRCDLKSLLFIVHKVCLFKADILSKYRIRTSAAKFLYFGEVVRHILLINQRSWELSTLEATFLGPFVEAILAHQFGYLKATDYKRIEKLMLRLGLKISLSKVDFNQLSHILDHAANQYDQFAFPKKIGVGILVNRKLT